MSGYKYTLRDIHEFYQYDEQTPMSIYMPDVVKRIEDHVQNKNPLDSTYYKHMKLKSISDMENTMCTPAELSTERLDGPSNDIEIEDGFIFDTREHFYQVDVKLLDGTNKKKFKKYQEYFYPTGRMSDLCILNSNGPVGIKTLSNRHSNINLHYGFKKENTRKAITDLSCNVIIVDIGKRNEANISEEFLSNTGVKLYKILYLIREGAKVKIERTIHDGVQSIESKFIQFPNSSLKIDSYNNKNKYAYTQELNEFEVWDESHTLVNGKYILEEDNINNVACQIHHKGPGSYSNVDVKSTLEDKSHLSFLGEIIVDKSAIDTDAQLTNKNLQLSKTATVVTEPQLDINTKEISCSHGCTVSNVDKEQLYALQSKGINDTDARRILKECFLDLII